ncbi:IAA-alanine resistance protein 1 isoform C [Glycine soja]|uniref:IAA-alanine resistance protein 1 isoform C n=1 Tax=Glycine soja TaxID=3848 RepID=A0A445JCF9_GLYSO|nr:IAA-alanine resistance protein 1 isoform C [Glycine soja]
MALGRNKTVQLALLLLCLDLGIAHQHQGHSPSHSGFCASDAHNHCGDDHHHDHGHAHDHNKDKIDARSKLLPEELAEEEDMKLYGFGFPHHHHHDHDIEAAELSGLGLWLNALGCSFLVSMASLVCLIILPVIFVQGKPSKAVVDSLALFGAGAMLGDAFLHQLPHAFEKGSRIKGGEHSHSHGDHGDHDHHDSSGHDHAHSLADLSIGISILAGIVLFLLVEKLVRYVEENSGRANSWTHGHHHHHHNSKEKLKDDNSSTANFQSESNNAKEERLIDERKEDDQVSLDSLKGDNPSQSETSLRKRIGSNVTKGDNLDDNTVDSATYNVKSSNVKEPVRSPTSLVFGYLNLFSDGVHNFTDGMALGSAFLLYGSVGGWSRTMFLLAHELPQEIGDFGILIRSGFSIPKALFFNFLSALVALAGTALALLWGKDPGQSSLIEGFTAGGFIYIAIAGVLAEMNNGGNTTLRSTVVQIISLTIGMAVALGISLVE